MKRFVNVRIPVFLIFSLIAGILLGYLFIRIQISLFFLSAIVPVAAIIIVFCVIYSKKKLLLFCAAAIILLVSGTVLSFLKLDGFDSKELVDGDTYSICATVCDKGKYDSGEYITVKNVTVDGRKINGKIKAYLSENYGEYCAVGYRVEFTARITAYDSFPYGNLNYNAIKNIKYRCNVNGGLTSSYSFSLFGSVNAAIADVLYKNLDHETASIAFAMLTGNTDGIDDGSLSAFRYGGIAHIFAVSGLHIGIIYGLLRLICNKLRLNRFISFAVCIIPLFLYSGVCCFTLSSVRALIMCAVSAFARVIFQKYDALNSLAVSATILLFINPLNLLDTGFQLSVCAVSGIILLSKNIVKPFKKAPKKLKDAVGISLSAQAGTMPVMLARFGYLSGAGILLNIIVVPVLSAFFAVMFFTTALSLVLPFVAQYALRYAALPLEATISLLVDAGFEKTLISGFGAGAFIPAYYFGLFTFSDKFNFRLKTKLISLFCAVTFLCAYVPLKTFSPFNGYKIIVSAYYGGGEVLIKSKEGNVLIVTENLNLSRTNELLGNYYASDVDALVILGGENCAETFGKCDLRCDAYVFRDYLNIQPYSNKKIKYEKSFEINGAIFEFTDGDSLVVNLCDETVFVNMQFCEAASTKISFNERSFENCVYNDGEYVFKL